MQRKFIGAALIFSFIVAINSALPGDYDLNYDFDINDQQARLEYQRSIPITHWPDNVPGGPLMYDEWKAQVGTPGPFEIKPVKEGQAADKGDAVPFNIIVNSTLYPQIESSISQYTLDLDIDGYEPKVYTTSGGTPENLKAYLQAEYAAGMEGCILIGDLPVPWFETDCDGYTNFPIDLFYMDMDGVWEDTDENGMYDVHSGDMGPEIWIGRLTAGPLNIGNHTEAELVNRYFTKDHAYRTGDNWLSNTALTYVDDDWITWAGQWDANVGFAYNTRTLVEDGATTIAVDYENRLDDSYESILVCVHSWPQGHSFKIGDDWTGGSTHNYDIYNINPRAHFYNLFACSNSRYVSADYMGGWYIFTENHGLASVGSTKTGAMLHFGYFYGPFGDGRTIGQAFADWFETVASWGFPQDDICWFYGMTLNGDPTLKHLEPPPVVIEQESLTKGVPGHYYCDTISVSGGIPPYTWSIASDTLPTGLSLDSQTGVISGTPVVMGTCDLTIMAEDTYSPPLFDTHIYNLEIAQLCGDVNHDDLANILDITALVFFLYQSGPMPEPYFIGDVDGSGVINILDITYFIEFLYLGGPALQCP